MMPALLAVLVGLYARWRGGRRTALLLASAVLAGQAWASLNPEAPAEESLMAAGVGAVVSGLGWHGALLGTAAMVSLVLAPGLTLLAGCSIPFADWVTRLEERQPYFRRMWAPRWSQVLAWSLAGALAGVLGALPMALHEGVLLILVPAAGFGSMLGLGLGLRRRRGNGALGWVFTAGLTGLVLGFEIFSWWPPALLLSFGGCLLYHGRTGRVVPLTCLLLVGSNPLLTVLALYFVLYQRTG